MTRKITSLISQGREFEPPSGHLFFLTFFSPTAVCNWNGMNYLPSLLCFFYCIFCFVVEMDGIIDARVGDFLTSDVIVVRPCVLL
ncbi:hypothetical protein BO71DRAFT_138919 [Aspergillus ellipticus CBS 707.79]|uniref:Uncharacterized protein n=1 Tax=Aspergillus ellipticus CBS 707.79 TaxID=1448320 RepID=A0A319DQD2_9EURO|nr:hypothetical protein BO71DRAFT_138919 [Aspergillus ellipticus CBS 707.79]